MFLFHIIKILIVKGDLKNTPILGEHGGKYNNLFRRKNYPDKKQSPKHKYQINFKSQSSFSKTFDCLRNG